METNILVQVDTSDGINNCKMGFRHSIKISFSGNVGNNKVVSAQVGTSEGGGNYIMAFRRTIKILFVDKNNSMY